MIDHSTQNSLPKLGSRRLVERAVEALRERIVSGAYGSDGNLPPQGDLCLELGVSRSVVREAMQQLQSQRLIAVSQGRRPRVLPVGPEAMVESLQLFIQRTDTSLEHLAEVRRPLEAEIAFCAASRITDDEIQDLRTTISEMQTAQSIAKQVDADMQFHRILATASRNPIFEFLLDALGELLRASREKTIGLGGVEPALRGHRTILMAVENRDSQAARRAMQDHLEASLNDIRSTAEQHEK